MIELYRCMVPAGNLLNDNVGTHYKEHMNKIQKLTDQFISIFNKEEKGFCGFTIPDVDYIKSKIGETVSIRCEIWRCKNTLFDPQNYAKTFKAPIDLLVHNGFIQDDNWKFVNGITYSGGGMNAWQKRAFRVKDDNGVFLDDGLPIELTPDWWIANASECYNDVILRVLIE